MQQPRFRGCGIELRYRARVESAGKLLYNLGNYLVSKKEKTQFKSSSCETWRVILVSVS